MTNEATETEVDLGSVNTRSRSSRLRITDMKVAEIRDAPMHCTLLKLYTNQGLVGLGEVRDGASPTYALMLKSRIVGENPCDVERIFRRIKQFGGHGRQGGGVSGVEVALWDLAGKAYGVPAYQFLGGRFRDRVRMYCDTDAKGGERNSPRAMGEALAERVVKGFDFLKMDVGASTLAGMSGTVVGGSSVIDDSVGRLALTDKGLDALDEYVEKVRAIVGYEVSLAVDHIGRLRLSDCIRLARRWEKYSLAWIEDPVPWQYTPAYVRLARSAAVPLCTGEDIYLKEAFRPLLESGGVSVVHPDVLSAGGMLETKKIAELAQDHGVDTAIHMAESPIACMAAVHVAAASANISAVEFHSFDVDWWDDLAVGLPKPIIQGGYITVPEKPGLGLDDVDDEVLAAHRDGSGPLWKDTDEWDRERSFDRQWS